MTSSSTVKASATSGTATTSNWPTPSPTSNITTASSPPAIKSAASPAATSETAGSGEGLHVDCFRTAVFSDIHEKLNGLAFGESPETLGLDWGLVDKKILAAVFRSNETEAFLCTEPLYRSAGSPILSHWVEVLENKFLLFPGRSRRSMADLGEVWNEIQVCQSWVCVVYLFFQFVGRGPNKWEIAR